MKILIIGGTGTIGRKVAAHFAEKHEVVTAGRRSGDFNVTIEEGGSIKALFQAVRTVDAIVSIAGEAKWGAFDELSEVDYHIGLNSKLMGQVNLVRIGRSFLSNGGSFTLSTGILADHPVKMTASAAMVNGGIHSFVKAVALEMTNAQRINAVSLGLVEDSVSRYEAYFPGHNPIPMWKAVNAYVKSVEGFETGEIIRYYDNG